MFWLTTGAATTVLALIVVNTLLISRNRSLDGEIQQRRQVIAETAQRSRTSPLVRELIAAAQLERNTKIRELLTKYGIAYAMRPVSQESLSPSGGTEVPAPEDSPQGAKGSAAVAPTQSSAPGKEPAGSAKSK